MRLVISTTESLTDLTTELVVANNNTNLCSYIYLQILYGGPYQVGSGLTTGEELEQVHSITSKAGFTTKYKSSASKFQSNPHVRRK